MTSLQIRRYSIDIPQSRVRDMLLRVENARWPDQVENHDWSQGTELSYLRDLCAYWVDGFSWNEQERVMARLPQFETLIDDVRMHFVHARSTHESAKPLVLVHGWPGSFMEFHRLIPMLTQPEKFGGSPDDAFHVVAPSLPGYGFSSTPTVRGWGLERIAKSIDTLMDGLGYDRYGAQGGDWGSPISLAIGRLFPKRVMGVHVNMVPVPPPQDADMSALTPQELVNLQHSVIWQTEGNGYFRQQSTKPQTLGYGLMDSPVGLAAWMIEKFRDWSDCDGEVETTFDRDWLLTSISLYWLTGNVTSASRLYWEQEHNPAPLTCQEVPVACAIFPKDIVVPPRAWAEVHLNVQRWTNFEKGGHFAAAEEPELLAADVREFFAGTS